MARYIFDNGRTGDEHRFVGWDDINGEACEATRWNKLGMRAPEHIRKAFAALEPGQTKTMASNNRVRRLY